MNFTAARLDLQNDGPHTPDGVLDAARAISDLADHLARATTDPHTTGEVLGDVLINLADATRSLDPLLAQVSTAALALRTNPEVYDDRGDGTDPADTAERVADAVAEARVRLARALPALRDAAAAASHLGRHVDPADEDVDD